MIRQQPYFRSSREAKKNKEKTTCILFTTMNKIDNNKKEKQDKDRAQTHTSRDIQSKWFYGKFTFKWKTYNQKCKHHTHTHINTHMIKDVEQG